MVKYTWPVLVAVTRPFFGAQPASSPVLDLKVALVLEHHLLAGDLDVVLNRRWCPIAMPVLGYGIGTPGGVAGVWGGVKHTSGKAQIDLPAAALHDDLHAVGVDLVAHARPPGIAE